MCAQSTAVVDVMAADIESHTWDFAIVPAAPLWRISWPAVLAAFPELAELEHTPQNPLYHAEGDVWTHTKLVCEALVADPAWRDLPPMARKIVFAAALFHDVGKGQTTREDAEGRLISPGHSRASIRAIRRWLWHDASPASSAPLAVREAICGLIRAHDLPLNWHHDDSAAAERKLIRASQVARCDWLAIFSAADVRGRICAGQAELLERVALFRELALELGCEAAPKAFATPHTKFVYFHEGKGAPEHEWFDDTRFEAVVLCGLPGAGKDTLAATRFADWPVVSLDQWRQDLDVEPTDDQGAVVAAAKDQAKALMREARGFVFNATNVSKMFRDSWVRLIAAYHGRIRLVYLEAPFAEIVRRNRNRSAVVPQAVMHRLAERLDVPDATEAHVVEWLAS